MIRDSSKRCHVPLTVGGGIKSSEHILELLRSGADKVTLNQAAYHQPELLNDAAKLFGEQCIVASIDSVRIENSHFVFDYLQDKVLPLEAEELAVRLQDSGAGEILINSVDRDGAQSGFDLDLVNKVCAAVSVPVICSGGVGVPEHFIQVFNNTRVGAASAANFFHFTEHCVLTTKAQVSRQVEIRMEDRVQYGNAQFDGFGRLLKRDDADLEELLYSKIEKEVI